LIDVLLFAKVHSGKILKTSRPFEKPHFPEDMGFLSDMEFINFGSSPNWLIEYFMEA